VGQSIARHHADEEREAMVTEATRIPLACDLAGEPVPVPAGAAGWRVWRHTGGRPRAVVNPDREPIELPLTASLDDLAALGPGLYRLRPITRDGQLVGGVSVDHDVASRADDGLAGRGARSASPTDSLLATAVRMFEASHRTQQDTIRELTSMNRELVHKLGDIAAAPSRLGGVSWKDFDDFEARKERAVAAEVARRNASAPQDDGDDGDDGDDRDKGLVELLADRYGMVLINKAATAWEQYCARDKAPPAPRNAGAVPSTAPQAASSAPGAQPTIARASAPATRPRAQSESVAVGPDAAMAASIAAPKASPAAEPVPASTCPAPVTGSLVAEPVAAEPLAALDVPKEVIQELEQRIAQVEQHLTEPERQLVHQALDLDHLPPDLMNEVARVVLMMEAPAAAKYLREAGCLDHARRLVEAAGGGS
jgi:hypothetical protein